MKRLAALLAVLVALTFAAVLPSAAVRAFDRLHAGMEDTMPCHDGACAPAAASCAAHCLSAATDATSVPAVVVLAFLVLALPALAFVLLRFQTLSFVPVACGPPGRFERRLLTVMKRE